MNRNLRSTVARVLIAIGIAATVLLAGGAPNDFTNGKTRAVVTEVQP